MLIEGLLVLAALAVTVLVVGALSLAQVAALPDPAEPVQGAPERKAPPIVPLMMIDSSGESAAILAEYVRCMEREGA